MSYSIRFTKSAVKDLQETTDYIDYVLLNPQASDHLLDLLDHEIRYLTDYPYSHQLVSDTFLNSQGIRFITVGNNIAFYIIDESSRLVTIIRFLYGKRDWLTILREEK